MAAKPKKVPKLRPWIIQQLRRLSMKWPARNNVNIRTRRELPRKTNKDGTLSKKPNYEHQCNICKQWFSSKEVQMDHINPVVDIDAIKGISDEEYIGKFAMSLFCGEDNFQKICINCHNTKTTQENLLRKVKK